MIRIAVLLLVPIAFLLVPMTVRAFDEIDHIGTKHFKPMKGCPNCHVRRENASGGLSLIGAALPNADLNRADLKGADMRGANLRESDLTQTDLRNAKLGGADLRKANLSGADLGGANLFNANLAGAKQRGKFGPVKLCNTTMPDGSLNNANCNRRAEDDPPRPLASGKIKQTQYRRSFNFLGFKINTS